MPDSKIINPTGYIWEFSHRTQISRRRLLARHHKRPVGLIGLPAATLIVAVAGSH